MRSLALLAVLVLPACLSLERPPLAKRRFVFEAARPDRAAPGTEGHLAVAHFGIDPQWASPGFTHRLPTGDVESDVLTEFFAPPATMVATATRRWLADAGVYATVTGDGSRVPPTRVLEGQLVELYVDHRGEQPAAALGLEVVLLDAERRALVRHLTLAARAPLTDLRPETIAAAWSSALGDVLAQLEAALRDGAR